MDYLEFSFIRSAFSTWVSHVFLCFIILIMHLLLGDVLTIVLGVPFSFKSTVFYVFPFDCLNLLLMAASFAAMPFGVSLPLTLSSIRICMCELINLMKHAWLTTGFVWLK